MWCGRRFSGGLLALGVVGVSGEESAGAAIFRRFAEGSVGRGEDVEEGSAQISTAAAVVRDGVCCAFAGPQSGGRLLPVTPFAAMFRGQRGEFQQSVRRSGRARWVEGRMSEGDGWLFVDGLATLSKRFLCVWELDGPMLQADCGGLND